MHNFGSPCVGTPAQSAADRVLCIRLTLQFIYLLYIGLKWYYMRHGHADDFIGCLNTMLRISKMTDYAIVLMVELTREGETLSAHAGSRGSAHCQ